MNSKGKSIKERCKRLLNQETNFKDEFKKNTLGIEICNTFCLWKHHLNLLLHAVINLRGVSTNKKYCMFYRHAILQRTFITHRLSSYVEQQQKYAHITCTTLKHPDFIRPPAVCEKTFPASFVPKPAENNTL